MINKLKTKVIIIHVPVQQMSKTTQILSSLNHSRLKGISASEFRKGKH